MTAKMFEINTSTNIKLTLYEGYKHSAWLLFVLTIISRSGFRLFAARRMSAVFDGTDVINERFARFRNAAILLCVSPGSPT